MTTTNTTTTKAEIKDLSSAECNEFNTRNAAMIEMGLMLPWQPTSARLADEKKEASITTGVADFFAKNFPGMEVKRDTAFGGSFYNRWHGTYSGCPVSLELVKDGHYSFSTSHWQFTIKQDSYSYRADEKRSMTIGAKEDITMTPAQAKKLPKIVAEVVGWAKAQAVAQDNKAAAAARKEQFCKANEVFMKHMGWESYHDFTVAEDGKITMKWETFTTAQWRSLRDLQLKHAADRAAMVAEFKTQNA